MGLFSRRRAPEQLACQLPEGALRRYASTPLPPATTPAGELALLAVDVETT